MFKNLLKPDSDLMIVMTQLTDCIFLSLFWLLGCVPVVTIGASCAALYDSAYRGLRKGDKHSWQRFFHVFRENWKDGILPTALFLILTGLTGKLLIRLWNGAAAGTLSFAVFSGAALVGVVIVGILGLLFPVLSRFENTLPGLLKNTLLLALANMPRTIVLGLIDVLTFYLCLRFIFPLFFLPALSALLSSLLVEPMLRPFLPKEEG